MCCPVPSRSKTQNANVESSRLLCDCYVFKSESEMRRSLTRLCHGNLFVAGTVGIEALKSVLLGSKMALVPVVKAASKKCDKEEKPKEPEKPKPMKFTELPLDKAPHSEYNTVMFEQYKCCGSDQKILEETLLPFVTDIRCETQKKLMDICSLLKDTYKDVKYTIETKKKEVLAVCRDQKNLYYRQAALASAAIAGFVLPSRKYWLFTRKFLGATVAATLVGALCFPKETDETVRSVSYQTAKFLITCYNFYAGSSHGMRPGMACASGVPEEPKPKKDPCGEERAKQRAELEALVKTKDKPAAN